MRKRVITDEERGKLLKFVAEHPDGYTIIELCKILNTDKKKIREWLKELNIKHVKTYKEWSDIDNQKLKDLAKEGLTNNEISKIFNTSEAAISAQKSKLNPNKRKSHIWTNEEEIQLKGFISKGDEINFEEIAVKLNLSLSSVRSKAHSLGFRAPPSWTKESESELLTILKESRENISIIQLARHFNRQKKTIVDKAKQLGFINIGIHNQWTQEEKQILVSWATNKENIKRTDIKDISLLLNRGEVGVWEQLIKLKCKCETTPRWTKEEESWLITNYVKFGLKESSLKMSRSEIATKAKAESLGLKIEQIITAVDEQRVLELYQELKLVYKVADVIGVYKEKIALILHKHKVKMFRTRSFGEETKSNIKKDYLEGKLSIIEICDKYDISKQQADSIIRAFDLHDPRHCSLVYGYQGKFKGKMFRSLKEACFIIHLDRAGKPWVGAEKIPIPYIFEGKKRTYRPDFISNEEMIEIKPKDQLLNAQVLAKKEAAEIYCKEHNLKYTIMDFKYDYVALKEEYESGNLVVYQKPAFERFLKLNLSE